MAGMVGIVAVVSIGEMGLVFATPLPAGSCRLPMPVAIPQVAAGDKSNKCGWSVKASLCAYRYAE